MSDIMMMRHMQDPYAVRCEWGAHGAEAVARNTGICVIADVLSFSTCVAIAAERGAVIHPCATGTDGQALAQSHGAHLAEKRGQGRYSLSPETLLQIPSGVHLVLPSPNGATLTSKAASHTILTGCLRNARRTAETIAGTGETVTVVPAGERWPDGSLRPAIEDWIGAGAIIHYLNATKSPEAQLAETAFLDARSNLEKILMTCGSGRELVARGYDSDVTLSAELNVSDSAPILVDGAYQATP